MFKFTRIIILDDNQKVDYFIKLAANHNLYAQYKIGVYGTERQNELFVTGEIWNHYNFKKAVNQLSTKK